MCPAPGLRPQCASVAAADDADEGLAGQSDEGVAGVGVVGVAGQSRAWSRRRARPLRLVPAPRPSTGWCRSGPASRLVSRACASEGRRRVLRLSTRRVTWAGRADGPRVHAYAHVHAHTRIRAHAHVQTHTRIHACTRMCTHIRAYTDACAHTRAYMHVQTRTRMHADGPEPGGRGQAARRTGPPSARR
jgi:hypothetical protein